MRRGIALLGRLEILPKAILLNTLREQPCAMRANCGNQDRRSNINIVLKKTIFYLSKYWNDINYDKRRSFPLLISYWMKISSNNKLQAITEAIFMSWWKKSVIFIFYRVSVFEHSERKTLDDIFHGEWSPGKREILLRLDKIMKKIETDKRIHGDCLRFVFRSLSICLLLKHRTTMDKVLWDFFCFPNLLAPSPALFFYLSLLLLSWLSRKLWVSSQGWQNSWTAERFSGRRNRLLQSRRLSFVSIKLSNNLTGFDSLLAVLAQPIIVSSHAFSPQ